MIAGLCSKGLLALVLFLGLSSPISSQSDASPVSKPYQSRYALPFEEQARFQAREILYALARAYPSQIERVQFRDGDWAVRVLGQWFYFAEGRLLPPEDRHRLDEFDPYPFYVYERERPETPTYTDEQAQAIEEVVSRLDQDPVRRHPGFLNALWRVDDHHSAWDRQKTTYFLGIQTLVHREILEDLAAVEESILELAQSDRRIADFVQRLSGAHGYTYREVDGTDSLSYHAYGVAIDLIPRGFQRWQMYWRWAREAELPWYRIARDDLFLVPEPIVGAFEAHGFVWGGKWQFYDTIHFEYRPELLLLNGFHLDQR